MPFKLNADRRRHIPKQTFKVTNTLGALLRSWASYDASLRQRGGLTVWVTKEAIAAWTAERRTTRGGQRHCSPLAILTGLTLRAVFRPALRQTEGLIGSVIRLLGLDLAAPDHSTLSRRAETLEVPRPRARAGAEPMHLLVDSTGLKLCGAGDWLHEKHGTKLRRSWRKLHLGLDAGTGQIVASLLTTKNVDDGSQLGSLLDQVEGPLASFTGDGAYDQVGVTSSVTQRHPDAVIIVPPRANAVPSDTAETAPTQRDRHLQQIAKHGRMAWRTSSGYSSAQGRDGDGALQAGDRRRPALARARAPGDRGGRRCSRPQPHAGTGTPELRPYRLNPDRSGGQRLHLANPCNNAIYVGSSKRTGPDP